MSIYDKANATVGYMKDIAQALEDEGAQPINPLALENLASNIRRMPLTSEIKKYTLNDKCGIDIPSGYESKVAITKISGHTIKEDTNFIHNPIDRIDSYFLDSEDKEQIIDSIKFSEIRDNCTDYGIGIDENTCNYIYWEKSRWYYKQMCELIPFSDFIQNYTVSSSLTQSENNSNKNSQYFLYTFNNSMPYKAVINSYFDSISADTDAIYTSFRKSTTPMMCLRTPKNNLYIRPSNIATYFKSSESNPSKLSYVLGSAAASVEAFEKEMTNLKIIGILNTPKEPKDITEYINTKGRMFFIQTTNEAGSQAQAIVGKNTQNDNKVAAGFLTAKFIGKTP